MDINTLSELSDALTLELTAAWEAYIKRLKLVLTPSCKKAAILPREMATMMKIPMTNMKMSFVLSSLERCHLFL